MNNKRLQLPNQDNKMNQSGFQNEEEIELDKGKLQFNKNSYQFRQMSNVILDGNNENEFVKEKQKKLKKKKMTPFPQSELNQNAILSYREEIISDDEHKKNDNGEQLDEEEKEQEEEEEEKEQFVQKSEQNNNKYDYEEILKQEEFDQTNKQDNLEDLLDHFDQKENVQENGKFDGDFFEQINQNLDESQEQIVEDEFIQDGNQEFFNRSNHYNFDFQPASTFSMSDYMKTTINDHYFNGDNDYVKKKLNDTIRKVYQYIESQVQEKQDQIKKFEKKLKKFVFDYRYDQYHQPRKYFHKELHEQNLKQKFQDPKYDKREIDFETQNFDQSPFNLFSNEVEVYVNTLSNELCIKQAFYNELEVYLKALYKDKCDIQSNYLYERRIYHQCILFTLKKQNLNLKIRIQKKSGNLFIARDRIIQSFYNKNKTELNIFSSFVLYWAQKRKLLSSNVMDKYAWINLIIYFFQINNRLPPSINYDQLLLKANNLEKKCYQKASEKVIQMQKSKAQPIKLSINQVFDFKLFEEENKSEFVIQYKPPQKSDTNKNTNNNINDSQQQNQEIFQVFKVLPIIRPSVNEIYKIREAPNFNYGFFFFKFLYYLNFQMVIDPIAISINGQIKTKKINNSQENAEPISIKDTIWPDVNLVAHLSFQQDAFLHLMDQIKLAYTTIHENKNEKRFLSDIPTPVFSFTKRDK